MTTAPDSGLNVQGNATNASQEGVTTGANLEHIEQPNGKTDTQGHGFDTSCFTRSCIEIICSSYGYAPLHIRSWQQCFLIDLQVGNMNDIIIMRILAVS